MQSALRWSLVESLKRLEQEGWAGQWVQGGEVEVGPGLVCQLPGHELLPLLRGLAVVWSDLSSAVRVVDSQPGLWWRFQLSYRQRSWRYSLARALVQAEVYEIVGDRSDWLDAGGA